MLSTRGPNAVARATRSTYPDLMSARSPTVLTADPVVVHGGAVEEDVKVAQHAIFYDGVCVFCNRLTRFVLARDRRNLFRFASLQSEYSKRMLVARGRDPDQLDTMIVITASGELFERARAGFFVLKELGFGWKLLALLRYLPTALLDWGYDRVSSSRYRWFGRYDSCPVPSDSDRRKFIEV